MSPPPQSTWVVEPARRGQFAAALDRVFAGLPPGERAGQVHRLLAAEREDAISLDGLLVARAGETIRSAVWAQIQPGRVAGLWLAPSTCAEDDVCLDALLSHALSRLADGAVALAQTLLVTDAGREASLLLRHGFRHLTDLLYLVSEAAAFPTARPATPLQFQEVAAADETRLAQVIERTYEATLDCPALNGARPMQDVLAGHRAAGVVRPEHWLIVRDDERDVGCLLLADHPAQSQWELVYTGVIPSARGQGWGLQITRHAQWLTRRARRDRLALAVDADNAPALAMYAAAGFRVWDRRSVYLRAFSRSGA